MLKGFELMFGFGGVGVGRNLPLREWARVLCAWTKGVKSVELAFR
ncbi:hypothetical protein [Rhodohalobacter halophilus]|nr:hypothetical protein [Rhodohalobacter halophilus]